ncbi:MAG: hypothetical protein GY847_14230 [Proteobacteria bacterium]|nr:hypothetical protein [Pseudomonadota bacterium]
MGKRRNPDKTWAYCLESERELPKDERTIFTLRTLGVDANDDVNDSMMVFQREVKSGDDKKNVDIGDMVTTDIAKHRAATKSMQHGVVNITNLTDVDTGEPVPFALDSEGLCPKDIIRWFTLDEKTEIANAIDERTEPSEDAEKN